MQLAGLARIPAPSALRRSLPGLADQRDRGRPCQCRGDRGWCSANAASTWIACRCSMSDIPAHDIIGDRALGASRCRRRRARSAMIEGLRDGGVVGVVTHAGPWAPRWATAVELPVVSASEEDLRRSGAFLDLNRALMGMAAHVVYTAWDTARPGSQSPKVIGDIVRGRIGFDGWLMSDDIGMQALTCGFDERARRDRGGCDVALHCSGDVAEMVAGRAGRGDDAGGGERLERALATVSSAGDAPHEELAARRDALSAQSLSGNHRVGRHVTRTWLRPAGQAAPAIPLVGKGISDQGDLRCLPNATAVPTQS